MMIDFFGTPVGLLSLAGLAALLILVSVLRRLAARARARRAAARAQPLAAAASPASPGPTRLPRWVVAAVAVWAAPTSSGFAAKAGDGQGTAPSAEAWKPAPTSSGFTAGGQDPWLAAGWRSVGVTK